MPRTSPYIAIMRSVAALATYVCISRYRVYDSIREAGGHAWKINMEANSTRRHLLATGIVMALFVIKMDTDYLENHIG